MKPGTKLALLQWSARLLGVLVFLVWSGFFLEHLEWFGDPYNLPPARVFFGQLAHMVFLLGCLVAFRYELTGSIFMVTGSIILFSRVGSPLAFLVMTSTGMLPAVLYLIHWWHSGGQDSLFYNLITGRGGEEIDPRRVYAIVARWSLRIAAAFIAVLALAYYFGGETFMILFQPGTGWTVHISEGFPQPFSMGLRELAVFSAACLSAVSVIIAWIWELPGGTALCSVSVFYAILSDTGGYPLSPAGAVTGALFILLALYDRNRKRGSITETVSGI